MAFWLFLAIILANNRIAYLAIFGYIYRYVLQNQLVDHHARDALTHC